jgi:hypothetical protein
VNDGATLRDSQREKERKREREKERKREREKERKREREKERKREREKERQKTVRNTQGALQTRNEEGIGTSIPGT